MVLMNIVKVKQKGLWREGEENRPKIFIPCIWSRKWKKMAQYEMLNIPRFPWQLYLDILRFPWQLYLQYTPPKKKNRRPDYVE